MRGYVAIIVVAGENVADEVPRHAEPALLVPDVGKALTKPEVAHDDAPRKIIRVGRGHGEAPSVGAGGRLRPLVVTALPSRAEGAVQAE
jgi:hypothetical protein